MSARLLLVLLIALLMPGLLWGAVYKRVAPDGSVYYSDQPEPGAKQIDLPESTTYTPPPLPKRHLPQRKKPQGLKPRDDHKPYTVLSITSPKDGETLRANDGSVPVSLRIEPALQAGDIVRLSLDGRLLPLKITAPSLVLKNVDRGSHSLSARIEGKGGKTLISSASVSFHLRRTSILLPGRRPTRPTPAPK